MLSKFLQYANADLPISVTLSGIVTSTSSLQNANACALMFAIDRIRQIKEKGLRRLRTGKAKRELLEKFDIVEAGAYRNSINKFNEHGFTSTVEYIALRRAELQAEYEKHKRQVEIMLEQRKRKCL